MKMNLEEAEEVAELLAKQVQQLSQSRDDVYRQLAEAREVLKAVEWSRPNNYYSAIGNRCPVCRNQDTEGHAPGCALAKVLGGEK